MLRFDGISARIIANLSKRHASRERRETLSSTQRIKQFDIPSSCTPLFCISWGTHRKHTHTRTHTHIQTYKHDSVLHMVYILAYLFVMTDGFNLLWKIPWRMSNLNSTHTRSLLWEGTLCICHPYFLFVADTTINITLERCVWERCVKYFWHFTQYFEWILSNLQC